MKSTKRTLSNRARNLKPIEDADALVLIANCTVLGIRSLIAQLFPTPHATLILSNPLPYVVAVLPPIDVAAGWIVHKFTTLQHARERVLEIFCNHHDRIALFVALPPDEAPAFRNIAPNRRILETGTETL